MISCLRNCLTCVPCRRNNAGVRVHDGEFQLKHIILAKGPYIVVVYFSDEDKGNEEVQKYLNDQYKRLENTAHSVRLSKVSEYTSNIFVEKEESSIMPDTTVPICYKNLQQECIVHRVRFKSSEPGNHYLQLQIAEDNTGKHRYPFHITLNPDDLCEASQNSADQGKFQLKHAVLAKGLYVVIVYFINDATGESEVEKYTRDHYKRVDNVSHGVRLDKKIKYTSNIIAEDSKAEIGSDPKVLVSYDALQQKCIVHRVRIKSSTEGEHCLQLQIKKGSTEMHGYTFDVTLKRDDLYHYYPMIRPPPPAPIFGMKKSLNRGNADGYLESTTSMKVDHKVCETSEIPIQTRDTGHGKKENIRISFLEIVTDTKDTDNEQSYDDMEAPLIEKTRDQNIMMQGRQLPPTPQNFIVDQKKDKIDLTEMLKGLNMENLMSVFEREKISHDRMLEMNSEDFAKIGVKVLEARKIMDAIKNYGKNEIESKHFYDDCGYEEFDTVCKTLF